MKTFLSYYLLTVLFYFAELFIFSLLLDFWEYDIFWLNFFLKIISIALFAFTARQMIFPKAKNFYKKYLLVQGVINPLSASFLLKLLSLTFLSVDLVLLKFGSDIVNSFIFYLIIKTLV